jgi:hypothetical protein
VVPRGQALRVAHAAGIGSHTGIAPAVALLLELPQEPHGGMAARIPALEEDSFVGVQHTVPAVTSSCAPTKSGSPEIAPHRAQTQPDLLRNSRGRPALAVQGPDLRMQRLPAGLALRRALLRRKGHIIR